jgi:transcriptional regulator with XRE-family HTH domain
MEDKNCFKDNLKSLRIEKGLGQVKLAELLGVSKSSISYWENGVQEPTMSALIKMAKFFGVSIDYLVGLED